MLLTAAACGACPSDSAAAATDANVDNNKVMASVNDSNETGLRFNITGPFTKLFLKALSNKTLPHYLNMEYLYNSCKNHVLIRYFNFVSVIIEKIQK
jgi:hypothetical protein